MIDPALVAFGESLLDHLCDRFPLGYRPQLVWNRRYRTTAGRAFFREGAIALGPAILKDQGSVRTTLTHEYAHLLAYARHGLAGVGHGEAWRQAMEDLGLPPNVYHPYPVEANRSRRRVVYRCARCGAEIVRARRLARGRRFLHADCGGAIQLVMVTAVTRQDGGA